jgi:hypothetical protein
MSTAELDYTFVTPHPDLLVRGRAQTVEMRVEYAGAVVSVTASGSTFSLLKPDGTAIVDAEAVTVTAGVPSFALTTVHLPSTLTPLGEGYQEVWTLVTPTGTRIVDREAALCLRPLVPVVSQATLLEDYPNLMTFVGATAITHLQTFITSAWIEIVNRLVGEGHLAYLIKSGSAFRRPHKELSYAKLFGWLALHQAARGNWLELATKHQAAYEAAWKAMSFRTDDDHDGRVDDNSTRRGGGVVVQPNAAPVARTARPSWL